MNDIDKVQLKLSKIVDILYILSPNVKSQVNC